MMSFIRGFWDFVLDAWPLVLLTIILGIIALMILVDKSSNPCSTQGSFECKNLRVEQCLASEQYTKDQCVTLIGGGR